MNTIVAKDIEHILQNIDIQKCQNASFLISGASGFFGRYFVDTLMRASEKTACKVFALSRNENDAKTKFANYLDNAHFSLLLQNVEQEIHCDEPIDYVIHAAGQANTKRFYEDPVGTLSPNSIGTFRLLELAKEQKSKGFLFLSSGAVYGDTAKASSHFLESADFPLAHLDIGNSYAQSKRMGESMCRAFTEQYQIPTSSARIAHTYGPYIHLDDGRVFSDFVKNILEGKDLLIKGDGKDKRPFCYISDALIALFTLLFCAKDGTAYNMANVDCLVSVSELAELLTKKAFPEKGLSVQYQHAAQQVSSYHYKNSFTLDTTKLKALGWTPKIGLVEGFQRTVKSFELESEIL